MTPFICLNVFFNNNRCIKIFFEIYIKKGHACFDSGYTMLGKTYSYLKHSLLKIFKIDGLLKCVVSNFTETSGWKIIFNDVYFVANVNVSSNTSRVLKSVWLYLLRNHVKLYSLYMDTATMKHGWNVFHDTWNDVNCTTALFFWGVYLLYYS